MSKRDDFETELMGVYPVNNQSLNDAFEGALEEAEERGFSEAVKEIANGEFEHPLVTELKARLQYLRLGGSWDMLTTESRATYIAGFEDAMKTLGVKP